MSTMSIPGEDKKKHDKNSKIKIDKSKPNKSIMTSGQALLNSMTAKKATIQKLKENAKPALHMTFDDEGNLTETSKSQPSLKKIKSEKTNIKKRAASVDNNESQIKKKAKNNDNETNIKSQPSKKKKKKEQKSQEKEQEQTINTDKKKQDALQYLEIFINNRSQWKFGKLQQSWLLQHTYDIDAISAENFDNLLLYIKDIKGLAREKTLKEAETICQKTKGTIQQLSYNPAVSSNDVSNYNNNDDDDFDAEKLLASMNASSFQPSTTHVNSNDTINHNDDNSNNDNTKLERAKEIVRTLI